MDWLDGEGPVLGGTPNFHRFFLQGHHQVLKVKIQEKFPHILGQEEEKRNHSEIDPELSVLPTKGQHSKGNFARAFSVPGEGQLANSSLPVSRKGRKKKKS